MREGYNRIAAGDVGRIAALSDGVFAFAATLLVLDVHTPERADIHSEIELLAALGREGPHILIWLFSLLTLGIFWVGQQTQLNQVARADRDLTWLNLLFLATITALPLSTRVFAGFFTFRVAFLVYWLNILLCGASLYATWSSATRLGLLREDVSAETERAIRRRIVFAQTLYAVGALVGLVNTLAGAIVIVAVQLNYAIAPAGRRRKVPARPAATSAKAASAPIDVRKSESDASRPTSGGPASSPQ